MKGSHGRRKRGLVKCARPRKLANKSELKEVRSEERGRSVQTEAGTGKQHMARLGRLGSCFRSGLGSVLVCGRVDDSRRKSGTAAQ